MNWFRVYHDIIDDPKILELPRAERWHVVELLSVASTQTVRGTLPDCKKLAIHLRIHKNRAQAIVDKFIRLGFIDVNHDTKTMKIHGWEKRQFKSDDVSARSAASMQRSRERRVNVHVNEPDTDTDTELKNKQKVSELVGSVGPEYKPVADLAESLTADPSWCMWVSRMARLGYAAAWIDYTIRTLAGKNQLQQRIAAGMLKNLAADGGPPKSANGRIIPKPEQSLEAYDARRAKIAAMKTQMEKASETVSKTK